LVDLATVNAVNTAAAAQSVASMPATLDTGFGALLQTMTGDPAAATPGAPIAAPNTTALPITNFAAATLIQSTATPDSAFGATASAASTIWTALPATTVVIAPGAPQRTAQDNKNTTAVIAPDATPNDSADTQTSDAATSLLAFWQFASHPAPMATTPQQTSQSATPQESALPSIASATTAAAATAATADSASASTPDNSATTDPSATNQTTSDLTAADQVVAGQAVVGQAAAGQAAAVQIAANQASTNQVAPSTADPAAAAAPDRMAAVTAAQALAAPRGTEAGTADVKIKAMPRASTDAKPAGDKAKSVVSDSVASSDKTGADKSTSVATADAAGGLKNLPVQPRQDGQTPSDQTLNSAAPTAVAAQPAPVTPPSDHAAAANNDAGGVQAVAVNPLANNPPKIAADIQVAAGRHGDDTSATLDKLAVTIAAKSLQGLHQFDIRLDPPDLGRVQVKLTVDDAGQAQASLVVDKPQTLDLLQRDSSSLNRVLTDAGLNLSNNGLSFSLRDSQQRADGGTNKGRSRSLSAKAALAADSSTIRSTSGSYAPNSVRLDIRV